VITTLELLKAKRASALALIDARKMESQLARLNKSAEVTGIKTNIRYVARLLRDHIVALDAAINTSTVEHRKVPDEMDSLPSALQ
jgi:hypothetical protein